MHQPIKLDLFLFPTENKRIDHFIRKVGIFKR